MNYIDLAIVIIIAILTMVGYRRGLFISLVEFVRYVVGLPLCFYVSNTYTDVVYQTFVRPRALESITNSINNSEGLNEINSAIEETVNSLPAFIANSIDLTQISEKKASLPEQILTTVFEPTLISLTKGALFILSFIVFFGVTAILLWLFKKARKIKQSKKGKSFLSKTDKVFGAAFGFCKSFVTILALSTILMYIKGILANSEFVNQVETSQLLPIIQTINPINFLIGG